MRITPWVSLIALLLSLLLLWQLGAGSLAWVGGALLLAALLHPLWASLGRWKERWRRGRSREKAAALDWTVIDQTLQRARTQRDCERPETLGVCTGRECLVYESCDFNIKKPL